MYNRNKPFDKMEQLQSDFEMYLTVSWITDSKRKRALLLNQAEPRVREIVKQIPETGTDILTMTSRNKN
jgi:hypothetical protein